MAVIPAPTRGELERIRRAQQYYDQSYPPAAFCHVPPGGVRGQVLVKLSNADFDVGWAWIADLLGEIIIDGGGPDSVFPPGGGIDNGGPDSVFPPDGILDGGGP